MRYALKVVGSCGFFLVSCISFQGFSQNYFDVANISYTNTPQNDFESTHAQTQVEEFTIDLNVPVPITEKTILITGVFANKTNLNLDPYLPSDALYVLRFNVGINQTFSDKWTATFIALPKIAADEIKLTKENFQLGFLSLFTHKKHDKLKYKYGLYVNTEKYGLMVVPILGLYYLGPNDKFEADLNLPYLVDINYKMNTTMWLGMKFDGLGTTFNLNDQNYSANGAYVAKTSNELISYLRFQLSKSLYVDTKVGYAISRNYKVFDRDDKVDLSTGVVYFGDDRTRLNERFKEGAIFKAELIYRIHF